MKLSITKLVTGVLTTSLWFVSAIYGMSLDEAKDKGLVGEKMDGYLGVVKSSGSDVQALAEAVNRKRHQAYEDIAKRNRTPMSSVETLAGEKAIHNTKPGHFIEGPEGWIKK
ncbi:conserved exported protein of unknown function [Nitrospira sp. KM1]|uniref:YdbL family protein n=1 Tax=Nitrospira sp. KM1 TaxID=1936990 RepID=UPI0013A78C07|nr:YdbL family protein [Nitrospira sp. KM1]BCA56253.1 conserved exported protein of unknown function [Nitrospira sp. KM1]